MRVCVRTRTPTHTHARARALVNKYDRASESARAYYSPGSKWRVLWNLFNPPDALALSHTNAGNCDRSLYPSTLVSGQLTFVRRILNAEKKKRFVQIFSFVSLIFEFGLSQFFNRRISLFLRIDVNYFEIIKEGK